MLSHMKFLDNRHRRAPGENKKIGEEQAGLRKICRTSGLPHVLWERPVRIRPKHHFSALPSLFLAAETERYTGITNTRSRRRHALPFFTRTRPFIHLPGHTLFSEGTPSHNNNLAKVNFIQLAPFQQRWVLPYHPTAGAAPDEMRCDAMR